MGNVYCLAVGHTLHVLSVVCIVSINAFQGVIYIRHALFPLSEFLRQEYETICCFRPTRVQESGNPLAMFFRSLAPSFNAQVDHVVSNDYITLVALLVSCF